MCYCVGRAYVNCNESVGLMNNMIDEKQKAKEDFEQGLYTQGLSHVHNEEYARLYEKQEQLTAQNMDITYEIIRA